MRANGADATIHLTAGGPVDEMAKALATQYAVAVKFAYCEGPSNSPWISSHVVARQIGRQLFDNKSGLAPLHLQIEILHKIIVQFDLGDIDGELAAINFCRLFAQTGKQLRDGFFQRIADFEAVFKLVHINQTGIELTVQINFSLVPGQVAQGRS